MHCKIVPWTNGQMATVAGNFPNPRRVWYKSMVVPLQIPILGGNFTNQPASFNSLGRLNTIFYTQERAPLTNYATALPCY